MVVILCIIATEVIENKNHKNLPFSVFQRYCDDPKSITDEELRFIIWWVMRNDTRKGWQSRLSPSVFLEAERRKLALD